MGTLMDPEIEFVEHRTFPAPVASVASQRRHVRIPVELRVTIVSSTGEHAGLCTDIGVGGMCISVGHDFEYGQDLVVLVDPVNVQSMGLAATSLCLPGTVRWRDEVGIGVQFGLLGAGETRGVVQLMRHWSERRPGER